MEFGRFVTVLVITVLSTYAIQSILGQGISPQYVPCNFIRCQKPNCTANQTIAKIGDDCCERCYDILGEGKTCELHFSFLRLVLNVTLGVCDKTQQLVCKVNRGVQWTCQKN